MNDCTFRPLRITEKSRLAQPYEEAVDSKNYAIYSYERALSAHNSSNDYKNREGLGEEVNNVNVIDSETNLPYTRHANNPTKI